MTLSQAYRDAAYTAKAGLFSALEVGASHLRRRIFILAHADSHGEVLDPGGHRTEHQGPALPPGNRPDRQAGIAEPSNPPVVDAVPAAEAVVREPHGAGDLPLFPPPPFDLAAWDQVIERRLA